MRNILLDEIKKEISTWDKSDIYVVSLYVYDECDNPCEPTVTLGYNTVSNYENETQYASDEEEAKWNYAFWLQNDELVFGRGKTKDIVKQWIEDRGFTYLSYDEMFNSDNSPDYEYYEGITKAFIKVLVDIVKELHSSGFIKEQFGKAIPVIIHELEYYDEIAKQNIEANSYELVEEFVDFCGAY